MITPSILDIDFYKLTMQQAVLEHYPDVDVEYRFSNRRPTDKFSPSVVARIKDEINSLKHMQLTKNEKNLLSKLNYLKPQYLEYLSNYRYDPDEVVVSDEDDNLNISIRGKWHKTIMWETTLMSIISECYNEDIPYDHQWHIENIKEKGRRLQEAGCFFADFGTRRRRSFSAQYEVVKALKEFTNFVGTSNVHLANIFNVKPTGTQAHEWIMGVSALESLRHANRFSMKKWNETYGAQLGTVLPDTFGLESFFNDFTLYYAMLFDSIRHDSGDPFTFTDRVVNHYKKLKIDPLSKTIIFSDGLNVDLAIQLKKYCEGKIKCSFGIGTNFTNDFPNGVALNMVIKLYKVNGIYVVKLSENPGKAIGEENALKVALWTFFNKNLI
jgi:nicotinate phosphoribosyltransferase